MIIQTYLEAVGIFAYNFYFYPIFGAAAPPVFAWVAFAVFAVLFVLAVLVSSRLLLPSVAEPIREYAQAAAIILGLALLFPFAVPLLLLAIAYSIPLPTGS